MKSLIAFFVLFTFLQLSLQKASIDPPCTADMDGVKEHADKCLHIICTDGKPQPVACMNDICPPGLNIKGKEPDDNTLEWPACCGQLICE